MLYFFGLFFFLVGWLKLQKKHRKTKKKTWHTPWTGLVGASMESVIFFVFSMVLHFKFSMESVIFFLLFFRWFCSLSYPWGLSFFWCYITTAKKTELFSHAKSSKTTANTSELQESIGFRGVVPYIYIYIVSKMTPQNWVYSGPVQFISRGYVFFAVILKPIPNWSA